jgi:glycine/D-amino acid oxidase-like deaminating enzyme
MRALDVPTRPMRDGELAPIRAAARATEAAGLLYEATGHVLDPLEAVRALAQGAADRGATVSRLDVRSVQPRGAQIEILGDRAAVLADAAIVCAGFEAGRLLRPLGVSVPLEGVRGYHVECAGAGALADAPVVYARQSLVVTPLRGRLRASSYMEFARPGAPPDPRKPAHLRALARSLGYPFDAEGPSWMGVRPVLPDYLPGIGRVRGTRIFYAVGHQHVGLTTAPLTGELIADLLAEREPRIPIGAFDLERFGRVRHHSMRSSDPRNRGGLPL